MTRLFAASLTGLALLSGAALAADLPPAPQVYKAPAVVAPSYSWTGLYLNAGGGYGMWTADTQTISTGPALGFPAGTCILCVDQIQGGRGWLGTAGGGFDFQLGGVSLGGWSPQILVGVMADYDFSRIKGTIQDQNPFFVGAIKETGTWAVGGRIGLIPFPQMLTYINGGYTNTHFSGANMVFNGPGFSGTPTPFATPAFNQGGWFLGGGTETSLAPLLPAGWFMRSEYRYAYYGTKSLSDTAPGGAVVVLPPLGVFLNPEANINFHPTVQTLTTSIVYKFNWQ